MAESTHEVSAHIKLVDKLSAPLRGISGIVDKLTHGFDHLSSHVASFATLGAAAVGALSIHKMIEETNEHMRTVSRLKTITGETTSNVDGMVEAFDKVGIGGSEAERIMMMLSRTGAKMEDSLQSTAMGIPKTAARMRALGVDITHGPYKAMLGLSAAVQKGKMDVGHLSRMMGIRPAMALDFMKLLGRGPQYLKETIEEMKKSGTAVTAENIAAFQKFQSVKNEVAAGWKRVQIVIGKELYPVIAQLLRNVQDKIPAWIEGAKTFGKFLKDHLSDAIGLAKTLGKVMLINATIMKVTSMAGMGHEGKGMGIFGALKAGGGRFMAGSGALGEKTMRGLAGVPIGPLSAGQTQMTPLMGVLMRLVQVGPTAVIVMALIAAAVVGFKAVMDNFMGLKSMLSDTWARLKATFSVFSRLFEGTGPASKALGNIAYVFKVTLPLALEGLMIVIENVVSGITKLVRFLDETFSKSSIMTTLLSLTPAGFVGAVAGSDSPIATWKRVSAQVESEQQSARMRPIAEAGMARIRGVFGHAPEQRGVAPYNDFRGSHFEITQSFDKGFDPDRIAVAFANDLATVGERKMQSGFAPMFAVR